MAKVGRNDPCPCGSGRKHKRCCLQVKAQPAARSVDGDRPLFVNQEIARLLENAAFRARSFRLIGALVFFATDRGDAWLLELTEQDALPVARAGTPLDITVAETEETLEIGWTHSFAVKGSLLITTSYLDGAVSSHEGCPVREIRDAVEQLRRQLSPRELESIRIRGE